jgi:hypothetical protein
MTTFTSFRSMVCEGILYKEIKNLLQQKAFKKLECSESTSHSTSKVNLK